MSRGLSIDIDGASIVNLASMLGATTPQIESAMRSAFGKMGRWLRGRGVKGLSDELHIQQKILRRRIRAYRMQGGIGTLGEGAKVWFGLRPIPFIDLRPKVYAKGVIADGGYYQEGAFMARTRGRTQVLKRVGASRHPLEVVAVEINDRAQVYVEDVLVGTAEFDAKFFQLLEHELRWRTRILT